MKFIKNILWLLVLVFSVFACEEPILEKPENLLSESKMIEMMVDIHLAEAAFQSRQFQDSLLRNSTSADFYYSVLSDHQVVDTVFEKSFVYYASNPKRFEKMYQDVMNQLNEMEQEYSGRKNEELDLGTPEKRN